MEAVLSHSLLIGLVMGSCPFGKNLSKLFDKSLIG